MGRKCSKNVNSSILGTTRVPEQFAYFFYIKRYITQIPTYVLYFNNIRLNS